MLVAMQTQALDMRINLVELDQVLAGKVGGQALLPEEVSALDFAFSLRRWGKTKRHAVEVKRLAQLGQRLWVVSKKQAVVIDVELQGQAILIESCGQQIQVGH